MSSAVIFDVDGVLVDSYRAHLASWRRLAAEHGLEITEAQFAETFGKTSRDIIARFWGGDGLDERGIRKLDERNEALYRRLVRDAFPAMDGARELIDALHDAGMPLAVGSSGPPENVDLALARLGRPERFGARVTGLDVTRGKPDPQVFLIAAERLQVEPRRCVVIEDAPDGVRAARRAGMAAVALVSTGRTREELLAVRPDLVVGSLRELSPAGLHALARC